MRRSQLFALWLCNIFAISRCQLSINMIGKGTSFEYLTEPVAEITDPTESSRKLVQYTEEQFLKREVVKVTTNIYVAIGWALGNSIMIEGVDGIIIVDTTETRESMKEIMVEFRKITVKPVKAIILTHFHSDHIMGINYIIEAEKNILSNRTVDVYSHALTESLMNGFSDTYDIGLKRGIRMIGSLLPKIPKARTGSGLGPELRFSTDVNFYIPNPTVIFEDVASYTVAGIRFILLHTPGETTDQITVWLPEHKTVLPGDNFYQTFPNMYTIRGSPARDSRRWYESLDLIRNLKAKYMIGSHTQPVIGRKEVYDALLIYRDAIKFVHDQTLRLMNKGYYPGQIVEKLKLPDKLTSHSMLQEHYGSVSWSARGVFSNYLGWFSGNPRDLDPMTDVDRAIRMMRLITYAQTSEGSALEIMLQAAQIAHLNSCQHYRRNGSYILSDDKWALELADAILEVGVNENLIHATKMIKTSALRAIGVEQISANGRNYYLTFANEVQYDLSLDRLKESRAYVIHTSPADRVLAMLCAKVSGLTCQNDNYTIGLTFTDLRRNYELTLRNSVCDIAEKRTLSKTTLHAYLSTTSATFKSITAGDMQLDEEVSSGNVDVVSGSLDAYKSFLGCFDELTSA